MSSLTYATLMLLNISLFSISGIWADLHRWRPLPVLCGSSQLSLQLYWSSFLWSPHGQVSGYFHELLNVRIVYNSQLLERPVGTFMSSIRLISSVCYLWIVISKNSTFMSSPRLVTSVCYLWTVISKYFHELPKVSLFCVLLMNSNQ